MEFDDDLPATGLGQEASRIPAAEAACPYAFFRVSVPKPALLKRLWGDSKNLSLSQTMLGTRHYIHAYSKTEKRVEVSLAPALLTNVDGVADSLMALSTDRLEGISMWQVDTSARTGELAGTFLKGYVSDFLSKERVVSIGNTCLFPSKSVSKLHPPT